MLTTPNLSLQVPEADNLAGELPAWFAQDATILDNAVKENQDGIADHTNAITTINNTLAAHQFVSATGALMTANSSVALDIADINLRILITRATASSNAKINLAGISGATTVSYKEVRFWGTTPTNEVATADGQSISQAGITVDDTKLVNGTDFSYGVISQGAKLWFAVSYIANAGANAFIAAWKLV